MIYDPYYWLKAAHLIFMVAWLAGLLVYPRYKLHQNTSAPGEVLFETMKVASNKLRRIILTPSIILVWVAGLGMIVLNPGIMSGGWLHLKLVLVLALSGLHGYFVALGKKIDRGQAANGRALKLLNEAPFVLLIVIVLLAVLRPF